MTRLYVMILEIRPIVRTSSEPYRSSVCNSVLKDVYGWCGGLLVVFNSVNMCDISLLRSIMVSGDSLEIYIKRKNVISYSGSAVSIREIKSVGDSKSFILDVEEGEEYEYILDTVKKEKGRSIYEI